MRKTPLILAAAITVVSAGCYRDFDFGTDSMADYAVASDNGTWTDLTLGKVLRTGTSTDVAVPEDWDDDGFWDPAVVQPNGDWVTESELGTISYPKPAVQPAYAAHPSLAILAVPADYDGDGDVEPAWYRESDGSWFIQGQTTVQFGNGPSALPGAGNAITENDYDFPVPADYDGDEKADLSVFNPWTGSWRVRSSIDGTVSTVIMNGSQSMAMAVPGDYDGVGHAQRAVYGPNGWFVEGHASPDLFGAQIEGVSDTGFPAPADYDGNGTTDFSYVDWNTSTWQTKDAPASVFVNVGGGDLPLPTGVNLEANFSRLNLLGFCSEVPEACV